MVSTNSETLRDAAKLISSVDLNHDRFTSVIVSWLEEEADLSGMSPRAVAFAQAVLAASGPLPTWDEMSDLDKGAALVHMWKLRWEGNQEDHPCRYQEHPLLMELSPTAASRHAQEVCGSLDDITYKLGFDEYRRLYNLVVPETEELPEIRVFWGIRFENGNILEFETEGQARETCVPPDVVVRRTGPVGEWEDVPHEEGTV